MPGDRVSETQSTSSQNTLLLCVVTLSHSLGQHLLLLLPSQLHLLLLLLEQHGSHVLLLRVGRKKLVPKGRQLMYHDQKLELLLRQALLGPCSQ